MAYNIEISIAANTKEEALRFLRKKLEWLMKTEWPDTAEAGGGGGGVDYSIVFGSGPSIISARAEDQLRLFHYERIFADMKLETLRHGRG